MAFTKAQIIIIGIGLVLFLFIVLLFMGIIPGLRSAETPDISGELTMWGVVDSKAVMDETLIASYSALHPAVAITYRQVDEATYEEDLINALASGHGPDLYMVKNTGVVKQADRLSPLTAEQYPIASLQAAFPNVVGDNFAPGGDAVYGFPLAIDTLALFYNQELFDNAGIANPPSTWEDLAKMVPRLRQLDATAKIQRAAIALGGSRKSVTHAADIVSLMMLQDDAQISDPTDGTANFAREGEMALKTYLNFANPGSELYTWNDSIGTDIDLFAKGEVAMMIGYRSDIAKIKEKNPFLKFKIAPMFQKESANLSINYPSYWGLVVSATSNNGGLAWDFIGTVTLNADIASAYLAATERSPALRELIDPATEDVENGFFARQALTAKSWRQIDNIVVDKAFSKMIESVLTGQLPIEQSLQAAEEAINDAVKRKKQAAE